MRSKTSKSFSFRLIRVSFTLISLFGFIQSNFSQMDIKFSFDTIYESTIHFEESILLIKSDEGIFYCDKNYEDSVKIFDLNNNVKYSLKLTSNTDLPIDNVIILNDHLAICVYNKILVFEKKSRRLIYTFKHDYGDLKLLVNNNILLYNNYNFHPLDIPKKGKTSFAIFNIKEGKLIKEVNEKFNHIYYTHLLGEYVDTYEERIVFSQTLPYELKVYDTNLNCNHAIEYKIGYDSLLFNNLDELFSNAFKNNSSIKESIYQLSEFDKKINRIVKVFFIDDSTILVIKKMSKVNKEGQIRYLDLWRLNSKGSKLLFSDLKYNCKLIDKNFNSIIVNVPFINSSEIYFDSGCIYFIAHYIPLNSVNTKSKFNKYKRQIDLKKLNYGIIKFRYEY